MAGGRLGDETGKGIAHVQEALHSLDSAESASGDYSDLYCQLSFDSVDNNGALINQRKIVKQPNPADERAI